MLPKAYCNTCKKYSFIIDDKFTCCEEEFTGSLKKLKLKRETEGQAKRKRLRIKDMSYQIQKQNNRCFYCGREFFSYIFNKGKTIQLGIHCDHINPFAYLADNKRSNFVLACNVCNLLKGSMYFKTTEEAQDYLRSKWRSRGYEDL